MTDIDVHPCPACGLVFRNRAEVEDHLRVDHRPQPPIELDRPPSGPTITVPVDPDEPGRRGPALASALAGSFDPPGIVEVVTVAPAGLREREVTALLQERAATIRAAGRAGDVRTAHLEGNDPADALIAHVNAHRPDLVCMATRRESSISELLLGSVTSAVVRAAHAPVLTCGPGMEAVPDRIRHIVVASDGSDDAIGALDVALGIARFGDIDVELVEVLDPGLRLPGDVFESAELRREAATHDGVVDYQVLHGTDVAETLIEHGTNRPDTILAIGTRGRTGAARLRFGSVAMAVMHRARTPVLVTSRR